MKNTVILNFYGEFTDSIFHCQWAGVHIKWCVGACGRADWQQNTGGRWRTGIAKVELRSILNLGANNISKYLLCQSCNENYLIYLHFTESPMRCLEVCWKNAWYQGISFSPSRASYTLRHKAVSWKTEGQEIVIRLSFDYDIPLSSQCIKMVFHLYCCKVISDPVKHATAGSE